MMPPAVEVEALTKRYGTTTALDEVSLEVEPGECLALLGPNGAGKSTLLECLATIKRPTGGRAYVDGVSVTEDPGEVRRSLGVAFQDPIADKHLTAREVLVDHARLYGISRASASARSDELLGFVGLEDRAGDRVSTFSGGMKRRLDLARVLTTDPDVLLLDEPTAGLDPRGRVEIQERLETLAGGGTTVLAATHDLDEAARLASRVAILDRGELVACDRPRALARGIGNRVVRVELVDEEDREGVRAALAGLDGLEPEDVDGGLEVTLDAEIDPSPGRLVDALEDEGLPYEEVTVREPDLGDVFLSLTGRGFDDGGSHA